MDPPLTLHCPGCGMRLAQIGENRYFCIGCRKYYTLLGPDEWEAYGKAEPRSPAFHALMTGLTLLGAAAAILLALFCAFGDRTYSRYYAREYHAYQARLAEGTPETVPAADLSGTVKRGDAVRVSGTVRRAGEGRLALNGAVECYFIAEVLDGGEAGLRALLDSLGPGDEVCVSGMVCDAAPCALKYCVLETVSPARLKPAS